MTLANNKIKLIAKKNLNSNYLICIIVTVVLISAFFIISNICAILNLITGNLITNITFYAFSFFLLLPLLLGVLRFFWRLCCGTIDNPICIFYYYSNFSLYKKAIRLSFSLIIRTIFCFVVFSIPSFVLQIISRAEFFEFINQPVPIWSTNLSFLTNFFIFFGIIATCFAMFKFYLAPILIIMDENMVVDEALLLSTVISKKSNLDFIFFIFSFSGWFFISLLIIPLIYTIPYFLISYILHCTSVVEEFNIDVSRLNHNDIPTYIAGV